MKRFALLLRNEFKLFRTAIPVHLIGIFQPALMFSLIALVLVTPTFEVQMEPPVTALEEQLFFAMKQVGSPIGQPYIDPVVVETSNDQEVQGGQIIRFERDAGRETAVQQFGLIDSNMVKNFRNRLTAAALLIWNEELGGDAITIEQEPWLPRDISYNVYFGMAMLPLAAMLASSLIGAFLTAQEFEFNTIIEYRLSPTSRYLLIGARLFRLSLTGLFSGLVLMVVIGVMTGTWPSSLGGIGLILLAVALIGSCIGTLAGLILQKTLPAFLVGLTFSFFTWIMGSAFGLSSGFSGLYEAVSRFMPNTYAVELLFPIYYRVNTGSSLQAIILLITVGGVLFLVTNITYQSRVLARS
ncbi:MAG: ABC transporter permease [Anaerolineales bacterium]|jgi:hypothetical protein